jgi:Fe-S-cluster-containing hydrogenase component 2
LGQHKVMFCTLCKKCIDVCPTDALRWHSITGAVELIRDRCTACDKCVAVCPTKVIVRSDKGVPELPWFPIICDLCDGDPACVKSCPTGALLLGERKVLR